MLRVAYRAADQRAILSWDDSDVGKPWLPILRNLLLGASDEGQVEGGNTFSAPWWSFVGVRGQFAELLSAFGLRVGEDVFVDDNAAAFLKRSTRNAESYASATNGLAIEAHELLQKLREKGFNRTLTQHQLRNVRKLAALPAAATFSVPGAGKTTEALATFAFRSANDDKLLVIAPKNAFAAWDEQLALCFPGNAIEFVRLRGPHIGRALQANPKFMIVSYQQLPRSRDLVASHLSRHVVHVFVDESHRIKSGPARTTARAVLSCSQLAAGKLVMSGTPMPQAREDLLPQFSFLYPEVLATADNVIERMRPIYVRTNKRELGLKKQIVLTKTLSMSPLQRELYGYMKSEVARQAAIYLGDPSRAAFRSLGRSIIRLIMFVSHPALLSRQIDFAKPGLLSAVLAEGNGPKLNYLLHRVRELAADGKKVLVWSAFRQNVEYIAESLQDLGAVFIHGSVDAGDEDDDATREGRIKLFHDEERVKVLVANPAAASEGISLHTVCHHAIYLDRTFNAAHFLQSMDRIHRLGLSPEQDTTIEIIECRQTIDETVRTRLQQKINAMSVALDDTSLRIDPIPIDPQSNDDQEEWSAGELDADDVQLLLKELGDLAA
jgi:SNF2 family DNA or RNA helicase